MHHYYAKNTIVADVELISIHQINEAYERTMKSDVKYRSLSICRLCANAA